MLKRLLLPVSVALLSVQLLAAEPAAPELALPADESLLPGEGPLRRQEVYVKRWQERRTLWAGEVARDQGAVVFLGDSITQGWGDDFKGRFPGLKLANRGIGADTTRGMLIRIEDVLALNPAAVVLLLGTNDIASGIEPEAIARNVQKILASIRAPHPQIPVVLCLIFPSSAEKLRPAETIRRVNALYAATVRGDPRVTVLDTWSLFLHPTTGDADPTWFKDMLHLNDAGYARWAEALRGSFAELGLAGN